MNVIDLFESNGDDSALVEINLELSGTVSKRRELFARSASLAGGLRHHGIAARDRVLIVGGPCTMMLESILAAFALGAVAMPVNGLLGGSQIAEILRSTGPACCIYTDSLPGEILDALRDNHCLLIPLTGARSGLVDTPTCYDALLRETPLPMQRPVSGDSPALIVHTSGSEGKPKAIQMSHRALVNFLRHNEFLHSQFLEEGQHPAAGGPIVSVLPLTHLGGLGICLHALLTTTPIYVMNHFFAEMYLRLLEKTHCRTTMLVPSMYRSLSKDPYLRVANLGAIRFCITLGEPCSPELAARIEAAFGGTAVSAYGMTECLSGIGHTRKDLYNGRVKRGSCGTHCFGEVRLVDDHGIEHANLGELWVKNPTVHECYLDPKLNESRTENGWFKTRDLFFRDSDGYFFHRGRADGMFISNGKNIYPAEIEGVLLAHPAVALACAAPIRNKFDSTVPAALILLRIPVDVAELQDFAARSGPPHTVPQLLQVVETLPEVGPGKVNRGEVGRILQAAYDRTQR
jgi:acyl-CoA synthetase (AMP-forming)/AMP-acid ligase II